jgi:16S rRNA (guanine527-N7)-methyltransferase
MPSEYHPNLHMPTRTSRNIGWDTLPSLFPGFTAPERWLPLLQEHTSLLAAAEERVRVTSVPPEEAVRRHYAESLEMLRIIIEAGGEGPIADVGSGGGFPGLVIAIIEPGREVHLVESLQKRAALLREMAEALGLSKVSVHPQRAEDAGRGPLRTHCGVVTARAVAPLRALIELTAPMARDGGLIALAKGSALAEEMESARLAFHRLGCAPGEVVPMRPEAGDLQLCLTHRRGVLGATYPRRPGVPERKPL